MCELPLQMAIKNEERYMNLFTSMQATFASSDYVIGNLETVFAGKNSVYTKDLFSFNTCDAFAKGLKNCGIHMVSTANNHCLDRGTEGLLRTIKVLDKNQIEHIGTYKSKEEKHFLLKELGNMKIGFLSYTYGTNIDNNQIELTDQNRFLVDMLEVQSKKNNTDGLKTKLLRGLSDKKKFQIKKMIGMPYMNIVEDQNEERVNQSYLPEIRKNIEEVRKQADYVILLLHCGGQFNKKPGTYTQFFVDFFMENGVDAIIGNHSHIVQKYCEKEEKIWIYSLGNFSISPSSIYVPKDLYAEYSILFNLYFDEAKKRVSKKSFQILKIVEKKNGLLEVFPVYSLYENTKSKEEKAKLKDDCFHVIECFLGKKMEDFKLEQEYIIY
jgi:poly-gamma-glutamate synthesis protein (capsule biosynthesis protein)